jgi:hypothetical protein
MSSTYMIKGHNSAPSFLQIPTWEAQLPLLRSMALVTMSVTTVYMLPVMEFTLKTLDLGMVPLSDQDWDSDTDL